MGFLPCLKITFFFREGNIKKEKKRNLTVTVPCLPFVTMAIPYF
jgi:hypothetical protein